MLNFLRVMFWNPVHSALAVLYGSTSRVCVAGWSLEPTAFRRDSAYTELYAFVRHSPDGVSGVLVGILLVASTFKTLSFLFAWAGEKRNFLYNVKYKLPFAVAEAMKSSTLSTRCKI